MAHKRPFFKGWVTMWCLVGSHTVERLRAAARVSAVPTNGPEPGWRSGKQERKTPVWMRKIFLGGSSVRCARADPGQNKSFFF